MLIRNFAPSDMGQVMELVAETFMQDYPPSMYLSLSSYWPEGVIVALEGGEVAGFVIGATSSTEEARILIMAVRKAYRRAGMGTAILHEFMARCRFRGLNRVILELRGSNTAAKEFFIKHGFTITGLLEKYYMDGEEGISMVKWL